MQNHVSKRYYVPFTNKEYIEIEQTFFVEYLITGI